MARSDFKSVDEYLSGFPKETQNVLSKIRKTIKKLIPNVQETISYQIPVFKFNGKFVIYLAGFKNHISVYPIPPGPAAFKKEIGKYVAGKGTIKFKLKDKIPFDLIEKIVKYSLIANKARAKNDKVW